jgi:hypothetical protein
MAGGRPTKYTPEFGPRLIELCKQGLSRRALCAELEISADTFYEWVKKYPEFSDAYKIGEAVASNFYEKAMISGGLGKIKGFNVMALTFLMKNRYPREFRDRQDVDLVADIKTTGIESLDKAHQKQILQNLINRLDSDPDKV